MELSTLEIPDYELQELLHETNRTLVYRAKCKESGQHVVLKIYNNEYPTPEEIADFEKEYTITKKFSHGGIVEALDYLKSDQYQAIVLEDFGGQSLRESLESETLPLEQTLNLAVQVLKILEEVHDHNVIHKDINTSNILWSADHKTVKLIDFGISTELSREITSVRNPNVLEGTLAYISPEQTGRMNRALDYRTDFYSLGVTLYSLLTNQLPFHSEDPMEFVHWHIARQATPPHEVNEEVPPAVSKVVLKLMAKNAEDRYQSCAGLEADLQTCLSGLHAGEKLYDFEPGRADVSERFQIPQKLYGREEQLKAIMQSFDAVSAGRAELMLVSGFSGIGKSQLVNEIHKPIVKHKGFFVSGKFDQLGKDVPYSAVIQAFQDLLKQVLTENNQVIESWGRMLREGLGDSGQVLVDVLPGLELIIGKQAAVPALGAVESQNRFNILFQRFIQVFAGKNHPLVLFLDDLQWADHASLDLIRTFLTAPDAGCLFLIGAFRNNEVGAGHPLQLTIDEIKKLGVTIDEIFLEGLELSHVNQLIADTLKLPVAETRSLAELVFDKTNGNPFFVNEFLKSLYENKYIEFRRPEGWFWDQKVINALEVTDNVAELMADKIRSLPEAVQDVLKLAACIGNTFSPVILEHVYDKPRPEILELLGAALKAGFIFEADDVFRFTHDRVQEAAYSLLTPEQREEQHLILGRRELALISPEGLPEQVFYIVNHLSAAVALISDPGERLELARMNLMAGGKAKSSAAYEPALNYFRNGIQLLPNNPWVVEYELTLALYTEAAESAYLCNEYAQMARLGEQVIQSKGDILDKVKVYEVKCQAFMAQNKLMEGLDAALEVLGLLGMSFPKKPGDPHIMTALLKTKIVLAGKTPESLIDKPPMKDAVLLAAMRMMAFAAPLAYWCYPAFVPLLAFRMVQLSARHGCAPISTFGFTTYGLILCGVLGDMEGGGRFGRVALELVQRLDARDLKARVLFSVQTFIHHWQNHLSETLPPLLDAYKAGLEVGDLEFAGHSAMLYCQYSVYSGLKLNQVKTETEKYSQALDAMQQESNRRVVQIYQQFCHNLTEETVLPFRLDGPYYDEIKNIPLHREANDQVSLFGVYVFKIILSYLFEEYDEALELAHEASAWEDAATGAYTSPLFYFLYSLACLGALAGQTKREQARLLKIVAKYQKKLEKVAAHAPMNHQHRFLLVEAERARIAGDYEPARELYIQSVDLAEKNGYRHEHALGLELTARFWIERGDSGVAQVYMTRAYHAYNVWGASVKSDFLLSKYPAYISQRDKSASGSETLGGGRTFSLTTTDMKGTLDLATVMKGSQAIAGEIHLDKLLSKMMGIVMENAGAVKGLLVLESQGGLFVEALAVMDKDSVDVMHSLPLEDCQELSPAIVQYVARTGENLVLNDVQHEGDFTADAYVQRANPRSILCMPVLHQGKMSSILYLENNLSSGAFTKDRLEVLKLLSSQIATSIDNARLYGGLEEKVQERTFQLQDSLDEINNLKVKQDGDYFLTSLLINPLGHNSARSESVNIDFFLKQHKQFKFRHWENELGGDICISHNITLANTSHLVFLNADAMGKSMQGAGGILVLGAVFHSIIQRARLADFDRGQSAAVWIKKVIKELQSVFESFDGSMLISLVLGVVEEESGLLHFTNVEHPRTVLFRDGRARYIESQTLLRKLGTMGVDEKIIVHRIQLREDDVIMIGSDGRDDLLLETGADGERLINEDESLFLEAVEEGQGVLEDVCASLLKRGELTDDLSLLSVGFRPGASPSGAG